MDYKQKLRDWNNTEKYHNECEFLKKLLAVNHEYGNGEFMLDYGCGLGMLADSLNADGFDVTNHNEYLKKNYYINELPSNAKFYENIYFMHSLAHIPNPLEVLKYLKELCNATITVITPNKDWLDEGYNNDTTVVRHYSQEELKDLFEYSGYKVTSIGQFGELKNGFNERIFLQAI